MSVPPPPGPGYPPPWNGPPAQGYQYPNPAYQGYPPPVRRGTNGFAIAALIFGIIGGVLLSVIFGFVALSQIKRSGQSGRGMAIAGLVLSGLWILIIIALVAVGAAGSADRDPSGQVTAGGTVSATSLQVGDCVNGLVGTTLRSLPAVSCALPHQGEVYAVFDLPAGPYPGQQAVDSQSASGCDARLMAYSPSAAADPTVNLFYLFPLRSNWTSDDRQVVCMTKAASGTTTGSIRGR